VPDSIEKIAEEMERVLGVNVAKDWAARLRALASPEHKAFLKAADEACRSLSESLLEHGARSLQLTGLRRQRLLALMAAYRAWKEAQRG